MNDQKILVTLDGSPLSDAALRHAQLLAPAETAQIFILRAFANPAAEFSYSDRGRANTLIQEMEAETLIDVQSASYRLHNAGFRTSFLMCQVPLQKQFYEVRQK